VTRPHEAHDALAPRVVPRGDRLAGFEPLEIGDEIGGGR